MMMTAWHHFCYLSSSLVVFCRIGAVSQQQQQQQQLNRTHRPQKQTLES